MLKKKLFEFSSLSMLTLFHALFEPEVISNFVPMACSGVKIYVEREYAFTIILDADVTS